MADTAIFDGDGTLVDSNYQHALSCPLFPALLALVSLLGLVGQQGNTDALIGVLGEVGAGSVADTLRAPLQQLTQSSAVASAWWSASSVRSGRRRVTSARSGGQSGCPDPVFGPHRLPKIPGRPRVITRPVGRP